MSRRIAVSETDNANIVMGYEKMPGCRAFKNHEELYQGRAGDLVVRFLFDFKDMKIVTAYPVFKEAYPYESMSRASYYAEHKQFM